MKKWIIGLLIPVLMSCSSSKTVKIERAQSNPQPIAYISVDSLDIAWSYIELGKISEQEGDSSSADHYFQNAMEVLSLYQENHPGISDSLARSRIEQISLEYSKFISRLNGIERDSLAADNVMEILEKIGESLLLPDSDSAAVSILDVIEEEQQITIPLVLNKKVENAIQYFQGRGRRVFTKWLQRTGWYKELIIPILKEEGVPEELFYLAMIESGFNPNAKSYARAVGIWQFIAGTGKAYGLTNSWWYDERRDPEKSTRAAAKHLRDLYQRFDNWYLAIAGYNYSPGKIEKRIQRYKVEEFWDLPRLPRQTRNYVPTFIAAIHIAKSPEEFGFFVEPEEPVIYDTVTVKECVDLNVVATCVNSTFDELKRLNPALLRWCTPPDRDEWILNIPDNSRELFLTNYSRVPDDQKMTYVNHLIRRGETLSQIARKYGVNISEIKRFNKIRGTFIREGQVLVIPYPQNKQYARVLAKQSAVYASQYQPVRKPLGSVPGREKHIHVVNKGQTLWEIANKYGVEISQIRSWNGLGNSRTIYPNQKLNIWLPSGVVPAKTSKQNQETASSVDVPLKQSEDNRVIIYTVKQGDTLWDIASRYQVSIRDIKIWNKRQSNLIRPGDELKIITAN
jgi:membrane-bound lytic murein transglycosylase D